MKIIIRHSWFPILVCILAMVASAMPVHADQAAGNQVPVSPIEVPNPAVDLWNAVREREGSELPAKTQVRTTDATSLINKSGEDWRLVRRDDLIPKGGLVLAVVVGLVGLLFLFRPSVPFAGGASNFEIERFDVGRRINHWLLAATMLFLALTGLVLLLGRFLLLPWLGPDIFGAIASASKEGHDLFGPIFAFALVLFFIQFAGRNLPQKGDLGWLLRFGGLFGEKHLKANFFNAGEKMLFWLVIIMGVAITVSGFLILFQNLLPGRNLMQLTLLIHGIVAVLFISLVSAHIYMAIAYKGTMQSMTTGMVDANWAKDAHGYWYQQVEESGGITEKTIPHRTAANAEATKIQTQE